MSNTKRSGVHRRTTSHCDSTRLAKRKTVTRAHVGPRHILSHGVLLRQRQSTGDRQRHRRPLRATMVRLHLSLCVDGADGYQGSRSIVRMCSRTSWGTTRPSSVSRSSRGMGTVRILLSLWVGLRHRLWGHLMGMTGYARYRQDYEYTLSGAPAAGGCVQGGCAGTQCIG